MSALWDLLTGKMARDDRARLAEYRAAAASRAERYSRYENPTLAEFIGSENICGTCHAVTPDMNKHTAWHARKEPTT